MHTCVHDSVGVSVKRFILAALCLIIIIIIPVIIKITELKAYIRHKCGFLSSLLLHSPAVMLVLQSSTTTSNP